MVTEGHLGVLQFALELLDLIAAALVLLLVVVNQLVELLVLKASLLRFAIELLRPLICSRGERHRLHLTFGFRPLIFFHRHNLRSLFFPLYRTVIVLCKIAREILSMVLGGLILRLNMPS